MQGIELLYVILTVAFVVPIVVMWRTRMIRIDARIEVPTDDAPAQPPITSMPAPATWSVSDAVTTGETLQPVRAASLRPVRSPSQRPVTLSDGSPKRVISIERDETLPMPVRRPSIGFVPRAVASASPSRPDGLPVPLRSSVDDDDR